LNEYQTDVFFSANPGGCEPGKTHLGTDQLLTIKLII